MDKLDQKTRELMTCTSEECGELVQACMKVVRYGLEKPKVDALLEEVGDVQCLIDLMVEHGLLNLKDIERRIITKRDKLKKWSSLCD
jgi:NTP pyrophosphatase (non-canonical NTP hydrolase)|tara:strand:- start:909 stop:1169 length:261 start_codon:yes stop_codon:yes gene_type:complete